MADAYIPRFRAEREVVPGTYDPMRRPGSSGQRYFSDITYANPNMAPRVFDPKAAGYETQVDYDARFDRSMDAATDAARDVNRAQATGLQALNLANPARQQRPATFLPGAETAGGMDTTNGTTGKTGITGGTATEIANYTFPTEIQRGVGMIGVGNSLEQIGYRNPKDYFQMGLTPEDIINRGLGGFTSEQPGSKPYDLLLGEYKNYLEVADAHRKGDEYAQRIMQEPGEYNFSVTDDSNYFRPAVTFGLFDQGLTPEQLMQEGGAFEYIYPGSAGEGGLRQAYQYWQQNRAGTGGTGGTGLITAQDYQGGPDATFASSGDPLLDAYRQAFYGAREGQYRTNALTDSIQALAAQNPNMDVVDYLLNYGIEPGDLRSSGAGAGAGEDSVLYQSLFGPESYGPGGQGTFDIGRVYKEAYNKNPDATVFDTSLNQEVGLFRQAPLGGLRTWNPNRNTYELSYTPSLAEIRDQYGLDTALKASLGMIQNAGYYSTDFDKAAEILGVPVETIRAEAEKRPEYIVTSQDENFVRVYTGDPADFVPQKEGEQLARRYLGNNKVQYYSPTRDVFQQDTSGTATDTTDSSFSLADLNVDATDGISEEEARQVYNALQSGIATPQEVAEYYDIPLDVVQTAYNDLQSQNFAQGGLASVAPKGMYLGGSTDGMADQIPATIDNRQPAALSDGEFVVPADVVSHLGNGNSDAGAKQLYGMMDRIRKARTGSTEQGKQINPNKFLA